jgi:spore coat polysaccharide biosynthesis protein SpsF
MGSSRLPGKVLKLLAGYPLLGHQLRRLEACPSIDAIVVATTDLPEDDVVERFVLDAGHEVYRGSSTDVLTRMLEAGREASADVVARVTGDCPLIDPEITSRVVDGLVGSDEPLDYASNVIRRTFPRGMDVEAFPLETLARMDQMAETSEEREHVTVVLRFTHPERFRILSIEDPIDNSDLRLTVDEQADLDLLERLFDRLGVPVHEASFQEIVRELRSDPELLAINQGVTTWSPLVREPTAEVKR